MRKASVALGVVFVLCAMLVTNAPCVEIMISPSTIVIGTGTSVTVHVEIPLAVVVPDSVTLEGIPASLLKADARGELVAKFPQEDIDDIVTPGEATMTLCGATRIGESFSGTDTVVVKAKSEKKR